MSVSPPTSSLSRSVHLWPHSCWPLTPIIPSVFVQYLICSMCLSFSSICPSPISVLLFCPSPFSWGSLKHLQILMIVTDAAWMKLNEIIVEFHPFLSSSSSSSSSSYTTGGGAHLDCCSYGPWHPQWSLERRVGTGTRWCCWCTVGSVQSQGGKPGRGPGGLRSRCTHTEHSPWRICKNQHCTRHSGNQHSWEGTGHIPESRWRLFSHKNTQFSINSPPPTLTLITIVVQELPQRLIWANTDLRDRVRWTCCWSRDTVNRAGSAPV